ncbi:hypothetical protein J6590_028058 [Homalodisca vitripennis]|nr:hypothetical protein J6590_028058 [Homalodisca vitripennis]
MSVIMTLTGSCGHWPYTLGEYINCPGSGVDNSLDMALKQTISGINMATTSTTTTMHLGTVTRILMGTVVSAMIMVTSPMAVLTSTVGLAATPEASVALGLAVLEDSEELDLVEDLEELDWVEDLEELDLVVVLGADLISNNLEIN